MREPPLPRTAGLAFEHDWDTSSLGGGMKGAETGDRGRAGGLERAALLNGRSNPQVGGGRRGGDRVDMRHPQRQRGGLVVRLQRDEATNESFNVIEPSRERLRRRDTSGLKVAFGERLHQQASTIRRR